MATVAFCIVPHAAAGPAQIVPALASLGHDPVFVAVAGALDEQGQEFTRAHGPLVECNPDRPEAALAELRRYRPLGITTFSEAMVPLTAQLSLALGLSFHDLETAALVTNKYLQRKRLAAEGVDSVGSHSVTSRAEALEVIASQPGPLVVKPRRGQSSKDTYLVERPEDLPSTVEPSEDRPFLIEEYIPGRDGGEFGSYISVESLFVDGEATVIGVTGKFPLIPPFREQGGFFPSHLAPAERDQVAKLAHEAALALGVRRGLVHTEIKLTPDGPRIIEVNGRIGGFMADMYQRGTGHDLLALGVSVACGQMKAPAFEPKGTVEFQYWNQPPVTGGILLRVEGIAQAAAVPGVVDYTVRVARGTELPPDVMTYQLDMLRGSVPDHDAMLATIDACQSHLRFVFEEPDGRVRTWRPTRSGLCVTD